MNTLLWRDLRVMFRNPRDWILPIIFFLLFLTVFAIAMNGNPELLKPMATPIIWLAAIFSLLLTFQSLFDTDIQQGHFEQLRLSGISALDIVISKFITCSIIIVFPLILTIPIAGLFYQLSIKTIAAIMLSLLIGCPALISYSIMSAALLAGRKNTGFMASLLTLPFLIPVIIFALSGISAYPNEGFGNLAFLGLFGLSLVGFAICIPAASTALTSYLDD